MGWLFTRLDKKALINELTKTEISSNGTTHTSIESHFDPYECVLWSVTEMVSTRKHLRYIECFLMDGSPQRWGYKNLTEFDHPYYYSCPLRFLKKVPVQCPEWRARVIQYHTKRSA